MARGLRFAVIPNTAEALQHLQEGMRHDGEHLMHLFVLGAPDVNTMARINGVETKVQGTRVVTRPATASPQETLQSAHELKTLLLHAAERP